SPSPSASTRAAAAAIDPASVTSTSSGASPSARSRSRSSGLRAPANTRNPRAARRRAVALPMPVEAPVMTTVLMRAELYPPGGADPVELGPGDRLVAKLGGRRGVGGAVQASAHPRLERARGIDELLLHRPAEHRPVEVAQSVVGVPHVGVRVEVHERQPSVD